MKTSRWTEDLASITGALWAKRGERGILPEAGDEGEEKFFFLLPSSRAWRKMPCYTRLPHKATVTQATEDVNLPNRKWFKKNFKIAPPPPLSQGLYDRPAPALLIWRSGSTTAREHSLCPARIHIVLTIKQILHRLTLFGQDICVIDRAWGKDGRMLTSLFSRCFIVLDVFVSVYKLYTL